MSSGYSRQGKDRVERGKYGANECQDVMGQVSVVRLNRIDKDRKGVCTEKDKEIKMRSNRKKQMTTTQKDKFH